jgi:hypothetical protein
MNNTPLMSSGSILTRNSVVKEHRQLITAMREIEKTIETLLAQSSPQWRKLEEERGAKYREIEPLIERYWDWIMPLKLSRCPFCEKDFMRFFDAVDLKGFWWMDRTQRDRREPVCCPHFCLLLGAVNLNGLPPEGGIFECRPGPDIPYAIPRILGLPSMVAVISCLPMLCGYSAYPVVYFSSEPPQGRSLTRPWARKEYRFVSPDGTSGWDEVDDILDYDLFPWLEQGKVRWYADGKLSPAKADPRQCPYLNVKGRGQQQVIVDHELRFMESAGTG